MRTLTSVTKPSKIISPTRLAVPSYHQQKTKHQSYTIHPNVLYNVTTPKEKIPTRCPLSTTTRCPHPRCPHPNNILVTTLTPGKTPTTIQYP